MASLFAEGILSSSVFVAHEVGLAGPEVGDDSLVQRVEISANGELIIASRSTTRRLDHLVCGIVEYNLDLLRDDRSFATNRVEGRDKERREGRLKELKPGESVAYDLEIGALTDKQECAEFEKAVGKLTGRRKRKIGNVGD